MKRLDTAAAVLVTIVVVSMGSPVLLRKITDTMLFHPERGQTRTPAALDLPFEEVWMRATDGVLTHGWWIPGEDARASVIFFHGNAGTMADRLEIAQGIRARGVNVLLAEYRGYGDSEGRPSELGFYSDAHSALDEALARSEGVPVIVAGRSLGGAVAVELAASASVGGLVVESTFTTLSAMASMSGIPLASRLVAYEFDSVDKISRVNVPILVTHGDADDLVPFSMGEALRDAAVASPSVHFHRIPGGGHNDILLRAGPDYWRAWDELIARVAPRRAG